MIVSFNQVLQAHHVDKLMSLYTDLPNHLILNGRSQHRHYASSIGHFMISEFTSEEIGDIWHHIKQVTQLNCDLVYSRILKYNKTCHISRHLDSYNPEHQKENDLSLIVQLSDPSDYQGGKLIVDGKMMDMKPGDLVGYTYDVPHEVKIVRSGTRHVLNLRCKMGK